MNSKSHQKPSWIRIDHLDNEPRYFHTSTLLDHYIITFGGAEQIQRRKPHDFTIFDVSSYQWKKFELQGTQPKSRYAHTACKISENKILIYGGDIEEDSEITSEILILTLHNTDEENGLVLNCKVKEVQGEPRALYNHSAEIYKENMYVFGGTQLKTANAINELWRLDLSDFQWTKCEQTGDIPSARTRHRSLVYQDKMYIFGGRSQLDVRLRMNDLFSLDFSNKLPSNSPIHSHKGGFHWKEIQCIGDIPSPRNGMSLVEHNGELILFGGAISEEICMNDLFTLSLKDEENEWKRGRTKNKQPSSRANHSCIPYKDGFFITGGADYERRMRHSDIFYLNLCSETQGKVQSNFQADISHSFLKEEFSDVKFVVEGQIFPAHKAIIANRCNYFVKLFSSEIPESKAERIEISDCKATVFQGLLEYIYCDKVELLRQIALELFVLAHKWRYEELERHCESYLVGNLTCENIVEVTKLASEVKATRLMDEVLEFIIQNLDRLKENGELLKFSDGVMIDVLEKLQAKWKNCKCKKPTN